MNNIYNKVGFILLSCDLLNRVYWVDASQDYIGSCDLEGKQFVKVLKDDTRASHPFAVAVYKHLMYWDDWKINAIFSADKGKIKVT